MPALRLPSTLLATVCFAAAAPLLAQAPAKPDPTKKTAPAEIVPPKPEMRPAPGQKALEPAAPSALSPGSKPPTASGETALGAIVSAMPEAELQQVLDAIKQRYVSPAALSDLELKRAQVQGLLDRLGSGANLQAGDGKPAATAELKSEVIEKRAGYVRLGALSAEGLAALDKALDGFNEQNLAACILDLRATPARTDFEAAAEVCRRFCPKGKPLFVRKPRGAAEQIFTSKNDPRFRGLLLVLLEARNAGNAEVIAAVLRMQAKALIIGQPTKAEAAEFAEVPLAAGRTLRLAVAEATLPDGESLLAGGVTPDIPVQMTSDELNAVLQQELEKGITSVLVEPERPRLNEAALVAGTNPEIDALQANQRLRGERAKPVLRDQMLFRALDLITSLKVLRKE